MNKVILVLVMTLGLATFFSCRKYEEGPLISFRTKTSRVVNDWTVKSVYVNAEYDPSHVLTGKLFSFTKEGRFTINSDSVGSWRFIDNYEVIYLKYDDKVTIKEYTISKLKEKEMWMYYYDTTSRHKIELRME